MTDTDSMISISQRMEALQAENKQLRAKLAEHELLFVGAFATDSFLTKLLDGLGEHLPNTVRSVEGIVGAVADMALKLDAHEDASTPAFDEIAKLCGCPEWGYPGQLVRDVENVVKERDKLRKDKAENDVQHQAMRACIVYARDRRGGLFVFEDWEKMVEFALRAGFPPPHALEDAQASEAKAWDAVSKIREERDFWRSQTNALTPANIKLHDELRISEAARDDARAASQRYLDEKRAAISKLTAENEDNKRARAVSATAIEELTAQWPSTLDERLRRAAEDAMKPDSAARIAYDHVYKVMGNEGTADERGDLFWRTLSEVRDGTFKPDEMVNGQLPSEHVLRHIGFDGSGARPMYECECGVVGSFSELTDENHKALRAKQLAASSPAHTRDCGTKHRGCAPSCPFDIAQKVACDHSDAEVRWAGIARCSACKAELTMEQVAAMRPELAERAWMPSSPPTLEAPGQCPWMFEDEDPDEGYWHCKHRAGHDDTHETESGGGRERRWTLRVPVSVLTIRGREKDRGATEAALGSMYAEARNRIEECGCSSKYVELAPGVHAKYCPLAGMPLEKP